MLVTAVVTTFNRPRRVRRAIRSVLAQTYGPLQIIVVEDGSDSGVEAWLRDIGLLDRVRYVRHRENRGLAAARNTGLDLSGGDCVAYLDDDDEWKPRLIERLVGRMVTLPEALREYVGVVCCGIEVHDAGNDEVLAVLRPRNSGNLRSAIVRKGASTLSSTFLFSKVALRRVGGFDERLPSSIDHDIWMSLASYGYEAATIDAPLVVTYMSPTDRMTANTTQRIQGVRMFLQKWAPTYREWFGEVGGQAYVERYFTRVVGRLAAEKLLDARFGEAWQAARAVSEYGGKLHFSLASLVSYAGQAAARRVLPRKVVRMLKTSVGRSVSSGERLP